MNKTKEQRKIKYNKRLQQKRSTTQRTTGHSPRWHEPFSTSTIIVD